LESGHLDRTIAPLCIVSEQWPALPTNQEWALEWLAGVALAREKGIVTQKQLEGARRRVLLWGVDAATIDLTIETKKAPPRGGAT